jgi:hypothetical protein
MDSKTGNGAGLLGSFSDIGGFQGAGGQGGGDNKAKEIGKLMHSVMILLVVGNTPRFGQFGVNPIDHGSFGFIHTFKDTVKEQGVEQGGEDVGLAVDGLNSHDIADVDGDEVAPAIGVKPITGNGKITDGGYLEEGKGRRLGRVVDAEHVDAFALLEHQEEGIFEEDGTGLLYGLRGQVGDVVQFADGDIDRFFPEAAECGCLIPGAGAEQQKKQQIRESETSKNGHRRQLFRYNECKACFACRQNVIL